MKKCFYIMMVLIASTPLYGAAQGMDFNDLFRKYTGKEDYSTVELTGALLKMLGGSESGDSFLGVNSFKMITSSKGETSFANEARGITSRDGFEALINISDGTGGFQIFHKPKGKGKNRDFSEFIMLAIGDDDVTVLYVEGDIDLKNFIKLSKVQRGED